MQNLSYNLDETYHVVQVFKLTYYDTKKDNHSGTDDKDKKKKKKGEKPLVSFACEKCKFNLECKPIKHKQDKCFVANDFSNILLKICKGHASTFYHDIFYLNTNPHRTRILMGVLLTMLKEKYRS